MSNSGQNLFEEFESSFGEETLRTMSHYGDPYTSIQAALKALKTAKGIARDVINALIKVYPEGISAEKLAERLGIESSVSGNDVAKRISNLRKRGVIEPSREKVLNSKGNKVTAWKLRFPPTMGESRWTP